MMLITIHDGCWKDDKFHGWGRLFQYTELEEMLGYASGVDVQVEKREHSMIINTGRSIMS